MIAYGIGHGINARGGKKELEEAVQRVSRRTMSRKNSIGSRREFIRLLCYALLAGKLHWSKWLSVASEEWHVGHWSS